VANWDNKDWDQDEDISKADSWRASKIYESRTGTLNLIEDEDEDEKEKEDEDDSKNRLMDSSQVRNPKMEGTIPSRLS